MSLVRALVVVAWAGLAVVAAAHAQPPGGFAPQCSGSVDYGWPRFESRAELVKDERWATYYQRVYGELPTAYPVCVYDLEHINGSAFAAANLTGVRPVVADPTTVKPGDLYRQPILPGAYDDLAIYHPRWTPIPNHTWVEVMHTVFRTELTGMWVWTATGSGVWANVGRTYVFPTPVDVRQTHAEAIAFLREGCSVSISNKWPQQESDIFGLCAREKGIDSIQFEPTTGVEPWGTFNLVGLTEMVLANLDGDKTSGVANASDTPLRSGWRASKQCVCTNEPIADTCGLMAKPPFPIVAEEPRLCEIREKNLTKKCTQATCRPTFCKVNSTASLI